MLIVVVLATAHFALAQDVGEQRLKMSSIGSGFGVQGEFIGQYKIEQDAVQIILFETSLYVSENCPYKGRRGILQLQFSLAEETSPEGRWKLSSKSEPISLGIIMSPGDKRQLGPLNFRIPIKANVDLTTRWLVVEIQEETMDPIPGRVGLSRGFSFAHSCKNIFQPATAIARTRENLARGTAKTCP